MHHTEDMPDLPRAIKAYDNPDFLHSPPARTLRILAEYLYPATQFRLENVHHTIIFFGSSRVRSPQQLQYELEATRLHIERSTGAERQRAEQRHDDLLRQAELCQYYDDAVELARLITTWSLTLPEDKRFYICTGGGPGIMEAGNKGAYLAGGKSIGLNISIPTEQFPNPYISPELNFEFHYFFMRKFWFAYMAKAMVIFPGGFGTLDELMEILTLVQTGKIRKRMPICIYGEQFWRRILNFDYMAEVGVITSSDLQLFRFVNSPQEAFEYLRSELTEIHQLDTVPR
ncbi:MAG: LOG family protein [Chlorobi bacterium]|jgi:hypothetical protein|nr:LOG family protein [Chlorobiota bacterium]